MTFRHNEKDPWQTRRGFFVFMLDQELPKPHTEAVSQPMKG